MMSMTADVIDIDELNTGKRREGVFGAIYWWMVKFGFAIAGLLTGAIMTLVGFVPDTVNSEASITGIRLFYSGLPIVGTLAAMFIMRNYNLTEETNMGKPFDVSKFRKEITKSIEGLSIGYNDPTDWVSTGNFGLNYLISGDFNKGVPLGKVTVFAGESGSGKSFICSGNLVRHAQQQGIYVVLIDSENALDEKWLHALGVDTNESKLLKLNMAMIDDVGKTISEFMKSYKALPETDKPKVLFIIDSLGMLLTPTDVNQFEAGDMKGDMGRKPKALTALVRNCVNMFGSLGIGLVATNHTYASQDMFDPDDKISGGQGFVYASSIVVAMKKLKLKEGKKRISIAKKGWQPTKEQKSNYWLATVDFEIQTVYVRDSEAIYKWDIEIEFNHDSTKVQNVNVKEKIIASAPEGVQFASALSQSADMKLLSTSIYYFLSVFFL